jgi:hypothetical protein
VKSSRVTTAIRDFAGASELREQLMHAKSTEEVRALIAAFSIAQQD